MSLQHREPDFYPSLRRFKGIRTVTAHTIFHYMISIGQTWVSPIHRAPYAVMTLRFFQNHNTHIAIITYQQYTTLCTACVARDYTLNIGLRQASTLVQAVVQMAGSLTVAAISHCFPAVYTVRMYVHSYDVCTISMHLLRHVLNYVPVYVANALRVIHAWDVIPGLAK